MSKITCAISGISYRCEHVPLTLTSRECAHPIFYTSQIRLLKLYKRYHTEQLTLTDSYLLFLALLHSTDNISFATSCSLDPIAAKTAQLIASNIRQLVEIIWQTNAIIHPSFKQPSYVIRKETADLRSIHNWIKAWKRNIEMFKLGEATAKEMEELTRVENKLLLIIRRGIDDVTLSNATAEWAARAADFPPEVRKLWIKTIRSCFNPKIMFNTPKNLILEIKQYCEENILVGSSHFHTLTQILKAGYKNHSEYLGAYTLESLSSTSSLSSSHLRKDGITTFTLCSEDESNEEANLNYALAEAPASKPVRNDYSSLTEFIKAKSKFLLVKHTSVTLSTIPIPPPVTIEITVPEGPPIVSMSESITQDTIEGMSDNIDTDKEKENE